ncbi:Transcription termination factor MTERF6, chloroplastic/mitochondrial [Vitis vinifera]|uniref:Transcription termination factor MTERF6, chloroplastic/mitochondrial n=1 Tax=Vitis vinifera TaxID=29760 RepID=A0A438JTF7_VITVI|nr:Transcription termination factor MTERF6, chloroplastic/mitochondrial [Vitis vinifera]
MEISSSQNGSIMWFFRDKGFDDKSIHEMFKKCKRLEGVHRDRASENWAYLRTIGIQDRKIPSIVTKCPKILALGLNEKIVLWSSALPLWEQNPALGVPEKQLGKVILVNPRLISYSIESKLTQIVDFLASLGFTREGMIGKVLQKYPFIMGYSVDKRLRPTSEFLKLIGLTEQDLQKVAMNFPEVFCRDANKILSPNVAYLKRRGFEDGQIAALVSVDWQCVECAFSDTPFQDIYETNLALEVRMLAIRDKRRGMLSVAEMRKPGQKAFGRG